MKDQIENRSDKVSNETSNDPISAHKLIAFIEYEEALTKDKETAKRISSLLTNLGVWKK